MYGSKRVTVRDLNPHIMCVLCGGYLIQATTVIECLHSFCRSCLVNFLETSKVCPICDVQVHKTRPLLNIRADQTLQSLVYKLVPGLFQDEMKKRREFHATTPESYVKELNLEERGDATMEKEVAMGCETISLVLQLVGRLKKDESLQVTDQRYLLCPSEVTIGLLKRFIVMKFNLGKEHKIAMYRAKEELTDDLMLQDVALIYFWKGDRPMHLCYTITYDHDTKRASQKKSITMQSDTKLPSTELNNNNTTITSTASKLESRNSASKIDCCREISTTTAPSTLSPRSAATKSSSLPLTSLPSSSSSLFASPSSSSSPSSSASSIYSSPSQSSTKCSTVLSSSVSSSTTSSLSSSSSSASSSSHSARCSTSATFSTLSSSSSSTAFNTGKSTVGKEERVQKYSTLNIASTPSVHNGVKSSASSPSSTFTSLSPATTLGSLRPSPSSSTSIYSSSSSTMSTTPSLPPSVVARVNTTVSPLKGKGMITSSKSVVSQERAPGAAFTPSSKREGEKKRVADMSGRGFTTATSKGEKKCENVKIPSNGVCHSNGAFPVTSQSSRPEKGCSSSQDDFEAKKACSHRIPNAAKSQIGAPNVNQNNSRGPTFKQDDGLSKDKARLPVPKTPPSLQKHQGAFVEQKVSFCTTSSPPLIIHSVQSILDHRPRKSQDKNFTSGVSAGSNVLKSPYKLEAGDKREAQNMEKASPLYKDSAFSPSKSRKSSTPGKWPIQDNPSSDAGQKDSLLAPKSNTIRTNTAMQPASNIPIPYAPSTLSNKPWVQRSISTDEGQGSFSHTQEKRNWKKRKLSEIDQESSSASCTTPSEFGQDKNGTAASPGTFSLAKSVECQSRVENEIRISSSSSAVGEMAKRRCPSSSTSSLSKPVSSPASSLPSSTVTIATWSRLGMAGMYPLSPMLDKRAGPLLFSSANVGAIASFPQVPWPSNTLTHSFIPGSPGRLVGKTQKPEAPPNGETNPRGEERRKLKSPCSNVKDVSSNKGKQEKVDDICVDISNVSGDSCSDVTSPGTSLTSPGLSVTSPGTDATSPGTEDRPDSSVLPDCQPPCEASYSMTILNKPTPLDLSSRHKKN